jgi:hypothetical protein
VCTFEEFPVVVFSSTTDQTDAIPGLKCSPLERPLPGSSWSNFARWYKIARLIEFGL